VSDNDRSTDLETKICGLIAPQGVTVDYYAGPEPKTQSANVNQLLDICRTELCILMHDDDFFLPNAIDRMVETWRAAGDDADAVFGRQLIVGASGQPLHGVTQMNDRKYFKKRPDICEKSCLASALVGQFPNNGMLIRTGIARAVRYPNEHEVGLPLDLHFSIRYALASRRSYVCIPDYTTAYRLTPNSALRSIRQVYDGHLGWEVLDAVDAQGALERWALDVARDRYSGAAVLGYLWSNDPEAAWALLRDRFWSMDKPLLVRLGLGLLVLASTLGVKPQRFAKAIGRARALFSSPV
jgi:glycosyltransferase involved in cell wall biosynthesis